MYIDACRGQKSLDPCGAGVIDSFEHHVGAENRI